MESSEAAMLTLQRENIMYEILRNNDQARLDALNNYWDGAEALEHFLITDDQELTLNYDHNIDVSKAKSAVSILIISGVKIMLRKPNDLANQLILELSSRSFADTKKSELKGRIESVIAGYSSLIKSNNEKLHELCPPTE